MKYRAYGHTSIIDETTLQLESILLQLIICWRRVTREEMLQKSCRRGIESPFKVTYLKFTLLVVKGLRYGIQPLTYCQNTF